MYIRSFLQDKEITITLSGEIDHHEAKHAMKTVTEKLDAYLPRVCVLDFRDVTFMDSSGIAVVVAGVRRMRQLGGRLVIANVQPSPCGCLRRRASARLPRSEEGQSMKPENELTMEFSSRSCNEAFARAAVGAFVAPMDPPWRS